MDGTSVVIVSVIASVVVTCMVTNIRCKQQLNRLDELFRDAAADMMKACSDIVDSARNAIEEARMK